MSEKKRSSGRPFQKGVSGNPGGRPLSVREVRELAQQITPDVLRRLYEINQDKSNKNLMAAVAAGKEILDRANGKSIQPQVTLGADGITDGETSGSSAPLLRARYENSKKLQPPNGNGKG